MNLREKEEKTLRLLKSQGGHWLRRCEVIRNLIKSVRAEALEEAAKIAETFYDWGPGYEPGETRTTRDVIAEAIRAKMKEVDRESV